MKTFLNIIGFTGKSIAMVFGSIIVVFASITLFHTVGIEEPQSSFNEVTTPTPKTEELKDNFPTPEIKEKAPEKKSDQKAIEQKKVQEDKLKKAEEAKKTAEYYQGLADLQKKNADFKRESDEGLARFEAARKKSNADFEAMLKKQEEEREQERLMTEAKAEQEYRSCMTSLDSCLFSAKGEANQYASSSAAGWIYRARANSCSTKYKCVK